MAQETDAQETDAQPTDAQPTDKPTTAVDGLRTSAREFGSDHGILYHTSTETSEYRDYADLDENARRIADALTERGHGVGDTIVIGLTNGLAAGSPHAACSRPGTCPLSTSAGSSRTRVRPGRRTSSALPAHLYIDRYRNLTIRLSKATFCTKRYTKLREG